MNKENIDKFLNFIKKRKVKVGDNVLCVKNFKFIKEVDRSDSEYVSKTGDDKIIKDIIKGKTYLFEKGNHYKVIEVSENSVVIESDVDKWNSDIKESQIFLFKSYISKYETDYFPILSDYFKVA
jgi:hypothetical protein